MNKFLCIGLHTIYAFGLLLIFIFSGSQYDWMADMDPSLSPEAIAEIPSRSVFLGVVLVVIVAAQLILAIQAKKQSERLISGVLIVAAFLAWIV